MKGIAYNTVVIITIVKVLYLMPVERKKDKN
jgi:hypothetical protein